MSQDGGQARLSGPGEFLKESFHEMTGLKQSSRTVVLEVTCPENGKEARQAERPKWLWLLPRNVILGAWMQVVDRKAKRRESNEKTCAFIS